jgi:hypothetical protein
VNTALVTKTLAYTGARALQLPGELDLPAFFAFSSLCEATVILDELQAIASSDRVEDLPLTAALRDAGLLRDFEPRRDPTEVRRAIMRLPEDVARLIVPEMGGTAPRLAGGDLRGMDELNEVGAVRTLDYERGLQALVDQLEEVIQYPSLKHDDPRQRLVRSASYLIVATANGMDYFPDFDRAPFVFAVVRHLYRSLPMQLYTRVAEALDPNGGDVEQVVAEWTLDTSLAIPPATALVLREARSLDEVPSRLLEVREEFSAYRERFAAFKRELQEADTLKDRRRLERKYRQLLQAASGPDAETVSAAEVLNLTEKVASVAANPLAPSSYSTALIAQPVEWIRRWWLRRPLAVLFRLDAKLPRISEYRRLIERLWGQQVSDALLDQYSSHASQLGRLYAGRSARAE